eukprot:TRINITY_DN11935_c0_g1_i3.p1 TRINITY_DN11935_c0_g1~~TRINITY_DN11935_c0_g1_i3.p1  ORF type:complete len:590 (+),score=235.43 TRINITY_DN11935_c0_g1_i3:44-1813(+)
MYGHARQYSRPEVETFTGTLEYVADPAQFDSFVRQPPHRGGGRGGYRGGGGRGGGFGGFNKFADMNKPWVTQAIKNEIWKKMNLADTAKRSKTAEDVAALQAQAEYVETLLGQAKISWMARNPDMEQEWLGVLAEEERTKTYFCDVCEKLVGTEAEFKVHQSEHATCGIDGCGYTAHQDILEKHIMHQHLTGLYNRIAHGDSPEEISKWREERKKNFPTQEKVEEKIAERALLKERGEVMWLKREKLRQEERERRGETEEKREPEAEWECNCKARHFVNNLRGRGRGRGRNWSVPRNIKHQGHCRELELIRERAKEKRDKRQAIWEERKEKRKKGEGDGEQKSEQVAKKVKVEKVEEVDSSSEDEGWNGGLWKFAGTKHVAKKVNIEESSNEVEANTLDEIKIKVETENLVATPGSELKHSDPVGTSDDEAPEEVKTVVSYENIVEEADSDSVPESPASKKPRKRKRKVDEDIKIETHSSETSVKPEQLSDLVWDDTNPPPPGEDHPQPHQFSSPANHLNPAPKPKQPSSRPAKPSRPPVFDQRMRPPTLLEKLLLNEIKKERNKILQCVRFVCKNNFFLEAEAGPKTE